MSLLKRRSVLLLFLSAAAPGFAAVVGTNPPAFPITAERVATLPASEQPPWRSYLAHSAALAAADRAFFVQEMKAHGLTTPTTPPEGRRGLSLNHPVAWFASEEARTLADHVLSFQTPAGGWSKNLNFAAHARQPGELFAPGNAAPVPQKPDDNDRPRDLHWHYVGTFDNDATTTQIQFLARMSAALPEERGAVYRAAWRRGLEYIFAAQFPNGGWPQVYPLEGGYHDAITFNDDAMVHILEFLRAVAEGAGDFTQVPADLRARAATSVQRGIACVLACQIINGGERTGWAQQHDALTLAPTSARNYEMPAKSGAESASLLVFLMALPAPSREVVTAVHGGVAWLQKTTLRDVAFRPASDGTGRRLQPAPGGGPLWARYYDLKTDRPLFGDRDKTIHDDVNEISNERRNGYSWFNNGPLRALEMYAKWYAAHPRG